MQSSDILEQLFDNNEIIFKGDLIKDKLAISFKNVTADDLFYIDTKVADLKNSTKLHMLQLYALAKLASVLKTWGKNKFDKADDAFEFLKKQPTSLIDSVIKKQSDFEKEISKALTGTEIENAFSEPSGLDKKLEPLQKD